MRFADGFSPIEDYAVIGDCRSAALVAVDGSIDWLCWPRFDSPALFAGLMDPGIGGKWRLSPHEPFNSSRHYEPSSNVLTTEFITSTGEALLSDFFFATSEDSKRRRLLPQAMLVRHVKCIHGEIEFDSSLQPAPDFGRSKSRLTKRTANCWVFRIRDGLIVLASNASLSEEDGAIRARIRLKMGERLSFILAFNANEPAIFPPINDVQGLLDETNAYWRQWALCLQYQGPYKDSVLRSALALKLLTYSPSGAIVAAPTTSLPEKLGASYNWDYRFCWLRDASYTVNAFLGLGMMEEASAFLQWLLHATRLTQPRLQVLYSVMGKPSLKEKDLEHLSGYRNSPPVRVGNAAHDQLQLDVYGEVINAAALCYSRGQRLSGDEESLLRKLAGFIMANWQRPDSGIWETRGSPEHFVHSKVLCWLGLQQILALHRAAQLDTEMEPIEEASARIAHEVRSRAFNESLGFYTSTLDGHELDAAALRLPILEFESAKEPRMASTIDAIERELSQNGLVFRHRAKETDGEGAFLICSFWLVQCLCLQDRVDDARRLFEDLCAKANDVGLYAEEIDPISGTFLGNFPQAFTHIGLINAALSLRSASKPGGHQG